jgi:hypothetical protein
MGIYQNYLVISALHCSPDVVYVIHILSPFVTIYTLSLGRLEVFFTLRLCFLSLSGSGRNLICRL